MITAVVMVGPAPQVGAPAPVTWVQAARRKATFDLLDQLEQVEAVGSILLVTPEPEGLARPGVEVIISPTGPVHVGATLARLVRDYDIERLLYLGGGAAPLLPLATLAEVARRLQAASRLIITNNRFASDWAGIVPATSLFPLVERLPRDNMLGWVLSTEAELPVEALPASAATRLDIDTPLDLQILRLHPGTPRTLCDYLSALPLPLARLEQARAVLSTPANQVFIAGRVAPDAWQALNRVTRCWLRVLAEERGMVSSGRQERGEVFSLLAAHIDAVGIDSFFERLSGWADAAFLDTRVLLAHHRRWPSDETRFASDLGRVEEVSDAWLRRLTEAAQAAPIPVLLGGHGLMAGALYAFSELVSSTSAR